MSSTLLCSCLFFSFTQFVILKTLMSFGLGIVRNKGVVKYLIIHIFMVPKLVEEADLKPKHSNVTHFLRDL